MEGEGKVLELVVYKLNEGVSGERFLGTNDAVSTWISKQPGFISRDLAYDAEGDRWVDVIWWETMENAGAAAELSMTSESCAPMFALIDMESALMLHGELAIAPVLAPPTPVGVYPAPMTSPALPTIEPEAILRDLLGLDPGLRRERYWGERSIFYNPGRVAPLGAIFASIKDHDGANDSSAKLSRDGVYRFAFCLAPDTYDRMFGDVPARPPKGGVVTFPNYEPRRLNELMPHPVYAWMRWVQILSPTRAQFESLRPHLDESFELVKTKWKRR